MFRIVLDTNAVLKNIENEESHIYKIIERCISGKIQCITSPRINEENEDIIASYDDKGEFFGLLDELNKNSELVNPQQTENNAYLEAAIEADADFLVTDDGELLDMDEYEGVRMLTLDQMWDMYEESSNDDNSWNMWDE